MKFKIFTCQIFHGFAGMVEWTKHRTKDGTPRTQDPACMEDDTEQRNLDIRQDALPGLKDSRPPTMDWTMDRGLRTGDRRARIKDRTQRMDDHELYCRCIINMS